MLEALRNDRFTRFVFIAAVLHVLFFSQWDELGDQDRARLATVEGLVDIDGTYAIDLSRFDTIDKVEHNGRFYSSKPTLLPTAMAGVYILLKSSTGRTFDNETWLVIKVLAIASSGVPFLLMLLAWIGFLRAFTDPARDRMIYRYCLLAGAFGTFLTGYSGAINNHVPGAVAIFIAFTQAILLVHGHRDRWWNYAVCGFCAGLAPTIDIPSVMAVIPLLVYVLVKGDRRRFLAIAVPASLIPIAIHFVTNLIATGGEWLPFYMIGNYHYDGSYWNAPRSFDALDEPKWFYALNMIVGHHGVLSMTPIFILSLLSCVQHIRKKQTMLPGVAWLLILLAPFGWIVFLRTNSYGGGCQGFRWLFWMIPIYLIMLPSQIAALRTKWHWGLAWLALGISILTALDAAFSPWGRSWVHIYFNMWGITDY